MLATAPFSHISSQFSAARESVFSDYVCAVRFQSLFSSKNIPLGLIGMTKLYPQTGLFDPCLADIPTLNLPKLVKIGLK